MKLLLTSAGVRNASIHDTLVGLLGKSISDCNAQCIPTAHYGLPIGTPAGAWRFINGQSGCPMCELGWKSVGVLELTALPSISQARWEPWVKLCADIDGFSLHAAVRCGADDRQALEQLCRYVTRPPWPPSVFRPTPPDRWCSS